MKYGRTSRCAAAWAIWAERYQLGISNCWCIQESTHLLLDEELDEAVAIAETAQKASKTLAL
jgi:hypothetical protein